MAKVKDIKGFLEQFAPPAMKMDFDNVGLLAGWPEREVTRAVTSLDITHEVISEAAECGAQLIVSHHPLMFSLKSVTADDPVGGKIIRLIENGISAICMHTNLDAAEGGVNDALANAAGIAAPEHLKKDGVLDNGYEYCIGRIGDISREMPMSEYLPFLKKALNTNGLRYYDSGCTVKRVAVLGGSGGSELSSAIATGCDTFLTADVKYDTFLLAKELGVNLIDGDHFCTENVVIPVMHKLLSEAFSDVEFMVSQKHGQTVSFI